MKNRNACFRFEKNIIAAVVFLTVAVAVCFTAYVANTGDVFDEYDDCTEVSE